MATRAEPETLRPANAGLGQFVMKPSRISNRRALLATLTARFSCPLTVIGKVAATVVTTFAPGFGCFLSIVCEVTRIFAGRHCWYLLIVTREALLPLLEVRQAQW